MMHSIFSHRPEGASKKPHLMPIACGRSLTPVGYFFSALLLFLFLFLPACGGGGGGSGGGVQQPGVGQPGVPDVPGVIGLTVIPASGSLHLSWTNPNINSITGFNITWQQTHDADGNAVTKVADSGMKDNETGAGANAAYLINNVLDNNDYTVSVTVLTVNQNSTAEILLNRVPGPNRDNDTEPDSRDNCPLVANPDQADEDCAAGDMDDDGVPDETDNCRIDMNPQQEDVNNDGVGDACETDAAQRPATEGVMDPIVIPGEESLSLAWTNPAGFITAFNISWMNTNEPGDTGMSIIDAFSEETNTGSETSSSFAIESLMNNANYGITITLVANASNSYATTEVLEATTGVNEDGDTIPDVLDNCPTLANSDQSNQDTDSVGDACDVDDDGNGLIEIRTAAELNNIRHNLAGTGYTQAADAASNSAGCPDSGCNGYELTANISLAGMDWIPIGGDADDQRFTADFDGNGNVISNVTITSEEGVLDGRTHIGFFARLNGATIQNLGLVIENFDVNIPTGHSFGGLSGDIENTEIINSYVIFSDVLSIETSSLIARIGGLSGAVVIAIVDSSYVVLPNNISISINSVSSAKGFFIGGIFGEFSSSLGQPPSINNSYVIYRGDPMTTPFLPNEGGMLSFFISGFGPDAVSVENSYALFPGNLSVAGPAINDISSGILPSAARSSYFHARTGMGDLNYRTLPQLRCPTGPDVTCDGATTYAGWDESIWNFGDANTLPTLRGIPSCPPGYPEDECRFGRSPE